MGGMGDMMGMLQGSGFRQDSTPMPAAEATTPGGMTPTAFSAIPGAQGGQAPGGQSSGLNIDTKRLASAMQLAGNTATATRSMMDMFGGGGPPQAPGLSPLAGPGMGPYQATALRRPMRLSQLR